MEKREVGREGKREMPNAGFLDLFIRKAQHH
jgi:hypothetical protein